MPIRIERPYLHKVVFECIHCLRKQEMVVNEGMVKIGTVIQPYAGGGTWGQCLFCKKGGLRAVTEPPVPTKGPEGWKRESSKPESK